MKALIKALPFVLVAVITNQTAQAETNHAQVSQSPKHAAAFFTSAIAGGLIAGPVGVFVAAIGAGWLVENESNSDEKPQRSENINTPKPTELAQLGVEAEPDINRHKLEATFLFGSNEYSLSEPMNDQLLSLSEVLKGLPNGLIMIDGHTDPRGGSDYNLGLSQRRGDTVANLLIAQGIDPALIIVRPYGETRSSSTQYDYEAHIAERSVDVSVSSVLKRSVASQDGLSSEVFMPVAQNTP